MSNLKGPELANHCPDAIKEAAGIVDEDLSRIGNETQRAFPFLHHCGLKL
jgi:hypothetical protein